MNSAPELAWRLLLFVFAAGGVVGVLISDPIFTRVSQPRSHPYASTLIVGVAVGAFAAAAWWFFVGAPRRTAEPLSMSSHLVTDTIAPRPVGGQA